MDKNKTIEKFGDRRICLRGVGKLYYQDGLPIEISVQMLKDKGIEVSYYHIADELLKNGFPPKRVINILREDGIEGVEEFCNASYEDQREMIFQYLFGSPSNDYIKSEDKRKELVKYIQ